MDNRSGTLLDLSKNLAIDGRTTDPKTEHALKKTNNELVETRFMEID